MQSAEKVVARAGEKREKGVIISEYRAAILQDDSSSGMKDDDGQLHHNKNLPTIHSTLENGYGGEC